MNWYKKRKLCLSSSVNDVNSAVSVDGLRDFSHFESERGFFEGFLHGPACEWAQITVALGGTAVAVFACQVGKGFFVGNDFFPVSCKTKSINFNYVLKFTIY